jgi:CheY-like chemotaxis protein
MKGGLGSIAGAKILLAEDNEINQQVACELLASIGLDVSVANNGKAVLEMVQNDTFDAILMDVQMPVMDGLTAAKNIRALNSEVKNIPIIALTAHAMTGDREKSLQAGMNDHITKPLDPEELFKTLVTWIEPIERPVMTKPPLPDQETDQQTQDTALPELQGSTLSKLPGIDTASALARVGGNQEALIHLIKKFSTGHADAVAGIAGLLRAGETQKAQESAHALKGVSGNIGAVKLHQAVTKLELAIKEGRTEEWDSLLDVARQLLSQVLASIQRLEAIEDIDTSAAEAPQPLNIAKIASALSEIKQLLENRSFGAGKQVDELDRLLKGRPVQKELADVKKLVERYRFKEALQALDKLTEALKNSKSEAPNPKQY